MYMLAAIARMVAVIACVVAAVAYVVMARHMDAVTAWNKAHIVADVVHMVAVAARMVVAMWTTRGLLLLLILAYPDNMCCINYVSVLIGRGV